MHYFLTIPQSERKGRFGGISTGSAGENGKCELNILSFDNICMCVIHAIWYIILYPQAETVEAEPPFEK